MGDVTRSPKLKMGETPEPGTFQCRKCRRQTGMKWVPKGRNGARMNGGLKRASCRFCGFIPEENRL